MFDQLFGQVIMPVDQRRGLENPVDPCLDLGVDRLGGGGACEGKSGGDEDEGAHGVTLRGRGLRSMERI